jgi:hypothetical protein
VLILHTCVTFNRLSQLWPLLRAFGDVSEEDSKEEENVSEEGGGGGGGGGLCRVMKEEKSRWKK